MSGDTKPSDNLVKFASGADVLIHEVGRPKDDPGLNGPPDEPFPGGTGATRRQAPVRSLIITLMQQKRRASFSASIRSWRVFARQPLAC